MTIHVLDDPYTAAPDRYRAGRPLTAKGFFQLLCEEVYCAGPEGGGANQRLLEGVARSLGLGAGTSVRIARRALARYRLGELGPPGPPRMRRLYERTLFYVWADGAEDGEEARVLRLLRRLLRLGELEHRAYLRRVRRGGYVDPLGSSAPGASPGAALLTATMG